MSDVVDQMEQQGRLDADISASMSNTVSYHSKIVGVTFEGRQDALAVLNGNEPLRVRREADNKFDKLAVAVDVQFGEDWAPIGYIAKDKNAKLAAQLDAGGEVNIAIASLTGGEIGKDGEPKNRGMNIAVEYTPVEDKVVETAEVKPNYVSMLHDALHGLGLAVPSEEKTMYQSRLLGKSVQVTVKNGHVSIPGYMGGSSFPKKFYPEFDKEANLDSIIDKFYGKAGEDVKLNVRKALVDMWDRSGEASTSLGTAIHAALENYDKYHVLGDKIKKVETFKTKADRVGPNKALSSNPFLAKIVQDFHDKFGGDYPRLTEEFAWLHDKKIGGSIDRVKVIDAEKKIIRIQDYKTNGDIHTSMGMYQHSDSPFRGIGKARTKAGEKETNPNAVEDTQLGQYWLQLSFYAYILQHYGYTVEGLDVYWLNPEKLAKGENAWEEYSHKVIDIKEGFNYAA